MIRIVHLNLRAIQMRHRCEIDEKRRNRVPNANFEVAERNWQDCAYDSLLSDWPPTHKRHHVPPIDAPNASMPNAVARRRKNQCERTATTGPNMNPFAICKGSKSTSRRYQRGVKHTPMANP